MISVCFNCGMDLWCEKCVKQRHEYKTKVHIIKSVDATMYSFLESNCNCIWSAIYPSYEIYSHMNNESSSTISSQFWSECMVEKYVNNISANAVDIPLI